MTGETKISDLDLKAAKKRLLRMHFESNVGHIGGNLSCLDALLVLYHEFIMQNDRFILSKGHSAGALYTALWSIGALTDDALKTFHKDDTLLAGHPPASGIGEIRFATGSLGHGLSLAAGTAMAMKLTGSAGTVFCLTSDGEWQEGSTYEAMVFAAHHRLNNLKILVDHNKLQGFGSTGTVASMAPLGDKLAGFDLDIQAIDGHDLHAIRAALSIKSNACRLIVLETNKGRGISFMEDRMEWHYLPINAEQYTRAIDEVDAS